MNDVTTNVRFEQSTASHGFMDVIIADAKTVIAQKTLGIEVAVPDVRQEIRAAPFEHVKRYADT